MSDTNFVGLCWLYILKYLRNIKWCKLSLKWIRSTLIWRLVYLLPGLDSPPLIYSFIFLYFILFFLFLSTYYKITILFFHSIHNFFAHKKLFLSLSHTQFFFSFHFWCIFFIFILQLYFRLMNFEVFGTLPWIDVIKFCVFKLLSF